MSKETKNRRVLWLVLLIAAILAGWFIHPMLERWTPTTDLAELMKQRAIPNVVLVHPHQATEPDVLELPGTIAAWYEAPIHSQVDGYVKSWSTDFGARVKKGQTLAVIDTPALDERLAQAREQLGRAEAALALAKVTAGRWKALRHANAVSGQSTDEKSSAEKVKLAEVGAAGANLDRLKAQKQFATIVAPFDGVVTARDIDIGSYVSIRGAQTLFKVADIHAVRVYVDAPQIYAPRLLPGMTATLTMPQWPGRSFNATIGATSDAIGGKTGSILVELDRPNENDALFPGSYVDVHFLLPADPAELFIPSSALLFDADGTRVATVDAADRIHFKRVTVAKDLGTQVEIVTGLSPQDRVADMPAETWVDGEQARVGDAPSKAVK